MELATGVRKHGKAVELLLIGVLFCQKSLILSPEILRLLLDLLRVVLLFHHCRFHLISKARSLPHSKSTVLKN